MPLRVLVVDDSAFARRCIERMARNRGYYHESCCDGEACVKLFEATLLDDSYACSRYDLIIMDKEMPTREKDCCRSAGVSAVKRIRELWMLHAQGRAAFKFPCIIGNSACTDETDPTMVAFRDELHLARLQAGMPTSTLMLKEKLSAWTDEFDAEVRLLCGLNGSADASSMEKPVVWGKPIRLQMLFRNLITNAIQHGRPSVGDQRVSVSYDIIDDRSRMHPCLTRSDQDDEVACSLCWQLEDKKFDRSTRRIVQVIVTDNGPGVPTPNVFQPFFFSHLISSKLAGIDSSNEGMKNRLVAPVDDSDPAAPQTR
jgi:CheY-like chemotaxis protein